MSDNEYKDLQSFGRTIEKKQEIKTKEKKSFIQTIKPAIIYFKKVAKIVVIKLWKITFTISKWIYKKIKRVATKIKTRKQYRRKIRFVMQPRQKKQKIAYKIVETKKQRRNKIVITRKRIPFEYNPLEVQPKKTELGALFYLTFKGDDAEETKPEAYTRLKESIWDFPIKKK